MASTAPVISQKEYLKKYLSKGKKKKKKPKISSSSILKRSQIIDDDDLGLQNMASIDDEEFNLDHMGDEAPQIAGVIDERPKELQKKEYYDDEKKWKDISLVEENYKISPSGDTQDVSDESKIKKEGEFTTSKSDQKIILPGSKKYPKNKYQRESDSDFDIPRKSNRGLKERKSDSDSDIKLSRKSKKKNKTGKYESDFHIESSRKKRKETERRKSTSDSDIELPRFNKKEMKRRKNRSDSDSDVSLHRNMKNGNISHHNKHNSDSDLSPQTSRSKSDEFKKQASKNSYSAFENSQRKRFHSEREPKNYRKSTSRSPQHHKKSTAELYLNKGRKSDSDISPPRQKSEKRMEKQDFSSRSYDGKHKNNLSRKWKDWEHDSSTSRRFKEGLEKGCSVSPPRKREKSYYSDRHSKEKYNKNRESGRENYEASKTFNGTNTDNSRRRKSSRSPDSRSSKPEKMLDGKKAGLQKADNLKEELQMIKQNEEKMFKEMSAQLSGKGAAPIMRDRKTGKKRDLEKEKEEAKKKADKVAERNSKYFKWGRGLKQVEDAQKKIIDSAHEMSKPLARYADDEDLEKFLKAQEREGDPMLEYFRQRQAESISCDNPGHTKYQGSYMPNRFGICPGHRWDGVDRSNGYEKQWFDAQNAKKALQEEAYKWSTSDM